jgi:hypothetical protein
MLDRVVAANRCLALLAVQVQPGENLTRFCIGGDRSAIDGGRFRTMSLNTMASQTTNSGKECSSILRDHRPIRDMMIFDFVRIVAVANGIIST